MTPIENDRFGESNAADIAESRSDLIAVQTHALEEIPHLSNDSYSLFLYVTLTPDPPIKIRTLQVQPNYVRNSMTLKKTCQKEQTDPEPKPSAKIIAETPL